MLDVATRRAMSQQPFWTPAHRPEVEEDAHVSRIAGDTTTYRKALGSFTTGVTVVTTRASDGRDVGLTANSFNSVSLDPPMVLWSLAKSSGSLGAFRESGAFAVHVLSADQEALSRRFAQRGADRFKDLEIVRGTGGVPLLNGCAARFQCRTAFQYEGGDHVILVGEVVTFDSSELPPLVFHGGNYAVAVKRSDDVRQAIEPESSFSRDFLGYLLGVTHYQVSQKVRRELDRRQLSEEAYLILGLGATGNLALAEMAKAVNFTGRRLTPATVESLARRGLVQADAATIEQAPVRLTEAGRTALVELSAIAKAAEADAEEELDYAERQLLKQLLRRLIRNSETILP
jgi:3-hydroxy-9,10-secoandrosta-1,3,5(10)-triene-9,17-dione monooxygenase reductase component